MSEELSGLRLLIRLRWFLAIGLVIACLIFGGPVGIILPAGVFAACIGILVASNVFLAVEITRTREKPVVTKTIAIAVDIGILTTMLYFAGGAHNPFTLLYLLFITVAVVLLPQWGAWLAVMLCVGGFLTLFLSPHALESRYGGTCCNDMTAHLYGMVIGMFVTGAGIASFVGVLNREMLGSRKIIAQLRKQGEEMRRASDVAMLATGIAHELATPLSTIAVISADIEHDAENRGTTTTDGSDARLIRREVERCRQIIAQLGNQQDESSGDDTAWEWGDLLSALNAYLSESILEKTRITITPGQGTLRTGQIRLFQCLDILIRNALEASNPGEMVELNAEIVGSFATFQVINHGVGFPQAVLANLGEPFVSGKSNATGLGLGLYLVRGFVTKSGGEFFVRNPGPGLTTVELKLPVMGRIE